MAATMTAPLSCRMSSWPLPLQLHPAWSAAHEVERSEVALQMLVLPAMDLRVLQQAPAAALAALAAAGAPAELP